MEINWEVWENVPDHADMALAHVASFCNEYNWSFELIWGGEDWVALLSTESEDGDVVELEGQSETIPPAIRYVIESAKIYYEEGTW